MKVLGKILETFPNPVRAGLRARRAFRVWNQARKARRQVELTSELIALEREEEPAMIDIGTRTSTNALVGGGILSTIYVQVVGLLPWPGLVAALTTPEAIALAATGFAWIVARFSKTPDKPGVL